MGRRLVFESLESRQLLDGAAGTVGPLESAGQASDPAMPDFGLMDVNPASLSYNQTVSPRDYLSQVSAWYFGHAT